MEGPLRTRFEEISKSEVEAFKPAISACLRRARFVSSLAIGSLDEMLLIVGSLMGRAFVLCSSFVAAQKLCQIMRNFMRKSANYCMHIHQGLINSVQRVYLTAEPSVLSLLIFKT